MDMSSFLPPMTGSFFGVFIAFALNYAYQSYNMHKDKIKYIDMIRSEIELCVIVLKLDRVELLPVDGWNSIVNSGALRLFEVDTELPSLSRDYYRIKEYNNKAIDYIGITWAKIYGDNGNTLPFNKLKRLQNIRECLLPELKELEEMEWLNPASVLIIKADEAGAYLGMRAMHWWQFRK